MNSDLKLFSGWVNINKLTINLKKKSNITWYCKDPK